MPKTLDPIAATVFDLTHDGRGVANIAGQRLFVADALPGEEVVVQPIKRRRRLLEAELIRIVHPAPTRTEPSCPYFGRCGGCAIQHMNYAAQIRFKQDQVASVLARMGAVSPDEWMEPVVGPQWNYRRRARLGVRFVSQKQRVLVGFRERSARFVTDMRACPVLVRPLDGLLGDLADVIGGTSRPDRVPQVEAAAGDSSAALVVRVLEEPTARDSVLFADFAARHEIDVYLQTGGPGSIQPVGGPPSTLGYRLDFCGVRLEFMPTDFIQVNGAVNAAMVEMAVRRADLTGTERVLDLFCGIGNFSLPLAQRAGELLGVESEAGLVARAAHNAKRNGIVNARFVAADLFEQDQAIFHERWDVVVLDPPRSGAEAAVAQFGRAKPRRIVYVSCHPATLARDARALSEDHGYRLTSAGIFDMFPNTHHVEVMAVFDR